MLKEQQKLEAAITEKSRAMEALALENERLRKHNKKLVNKHLANSSQDTTASSQESSPKSSFSSKSSTDLRLPPVPPLEPTSPPSKGDIKPPTGPKPPVPSRAGINKLLLQSTNLVVSPPPPPPVRSTSLAISHLERKDSGRESDLPSSDVEPNKRHTSSQDEGFCSSHEDSSGSGGRCSRTSSINHRAVQKPSDIKLRSKAKAAAAASSATATTSPPLSTLREVDGHPSGSGVTTVTYWTGSFL